MRSGPWSAVTFIVLATSAALVTGPARSTVMSVVPASSPQTITSAPLLRLASDDDADKSEKEPTPEEKMARRYPQPVKVSFLLGLPVLDENSSIIGYVHTVARTPQGKIQLVMPLGGFFGWGGRLVGIPVEIVGMLGAQVAIIDMPGDRFMSSPTWTSLRAKPLDPSETVRVAITRR